MTPAMRLIASQEFFLRIRRRSGYVRQSSRCPKRGNIVMEHFFTIAALWLALAVLSAIIAYHLRISIALVEICVGVAVAAIAAGFGMTEALGANQEWLRFLASSGAVLLTFLAGAELDPDVMQTKLKEVTVVGLVGFFAPFLGCTAVAYYILGWDTRASWLCGIALSTTSIAIVYAVCARRSANRRCGLPGIDPAQNRRRGTDRTLGHATVEFPRLAGPPGHQRRTDSGDSGFHYRTYGGRRFGVVHPQLVNEAKRPG
jgi:hypothetical protein